MGRNTVSVEVEVDLDDIDLRDCHEEQLIEALESKLSKFTNTNKTPETIYQIKRLCDVFDIPFFDAKTVEESLKVELFQRTWDKYTLTELEQILTR